MKFITDDDTYIFDAFREMDYANVHSLHGRNIYAVCWLEGEFEVYGVLDLHAASGQLAAYFQLRGLKCQWIEYVTKSGFRNPTTPYPDQEPTQYKLRS